MLAILCYKNVVFDTIIGYPDSPGRQIVCALTRTGGTSDFLLVRRTRARVV